MGFYCLVMGCMLFGSGHHTVAQNRYALSLGPSDPPFPMDTGVPSPRDLPSLQPLFCLSWFPRWTAVITDVLSSSVTMVMYMGKQELVDGAGGRLGESGQRNVIILTAEEEAQKTESNRCRNTLYRLGNPDRATRSPPCFFLQICS